MQIVCLNIKSLNLDQIKQFCYKYSYNIDQLTKLKMINVYESCNLNKKVGSIYKIWMDNNCGKLVAYNFTNDKFIITVGEYIGMTKKQYKSLSKMIPLKIPKMEKNKIKPIILIDIYDDKLNNICMN